MRTLLNKIILYAKIAARPVVWKLLDLYDRSISKKRKKVKQFDKIVAERNICFTTDINTEGFSDQLCRLIFFYKVGNSLGLKYYHTELVSTRSTPALPREKNGMNEDSYSDIYDFLGVNSGLKELSADIHPSDYKEVIVDLDQMEFEKRIRSSYRNLVFYLKTKLVNLISEDENLLIRFRSSPNVFQLYRLLAHHQKFDLPLRNFFFRNREKKPWRSWFAGDKIKLIVHIRQGDTAIIKTPWNTFIPVWYKMKNRYTEVRHRAKIAGEYEVIDVGVYYEFLNDLYRQFESGFFSGLIFSDGFHQAFETIEKESVYRNFTESQKKTFQRLKMSYDQKQFKNFYDWEDVDTVIGEEREKLFDFIQSFFEADMIIFGTQAKMIPKLVSIYTDEDTMPLLINLYQNRHPNIDYLGIDHSSERVLFVDVNDYNAGRIADRIKTYLASRNRI